jgi:hypothetical protein
MERGADFFFQRKGAVLQRAFEGPASPHWVSEGSTAWLAIIDWDAGLLGRPIAGYVSRKRAAESRQKSQDQAQYPGAKKAHIWRRTIYMG